MPYLTSLIFSIALIILNHIIFTDCRRNLRNILLFTGNKLYYKNSPDSSDFSDFYYVDLTGVSLDNDTVVEPSKWIYITNPPKLDFPFENPILGGKNNDKMIFLDNKANIFDTTLENGK